MARTLKVAILGATGTVGQKFIRLLQGHPWFKITELLASDRSAGKTYLEATRWSEEGIVPKDVAGLRLRDDAKGLDADVAFSAMPGGQAGPVERDLAKQGLAVFTNARDLRMEPDVPLVIAEVNPDHLGLVETQRRRQKSEGFVVANGNCTAIVLSMALKPLADSFGLKRASVVTMQSLSGAGYPGVPSLDATENVIPYIGGEEEKVETEPTKFLGRLRDGAIEPASFAIAATCTRVPVLEAHTEAVSVELAKKPKPEAVLDAWRNFSGEPQRLKLPSAPASPLVVHETPGRPQPRLDRDLGKRMSVSVGSLRQDTVLGWRFVCLGSNTVRGAAGGSILNAELALSRKLI